MELRHSDRHGETIAFNVAIYAAELVYARFRLHKRGCYIIFRLSDAYCVGRKKNYIQFG